MQQQLKVIEERLTKIDKRLQEIDQTLYKAVYEKLEKDDKVKCLGRYATSTLNME